MGLSKFCVEYLPLSRSYVLHRNRCITHPSLDLTQLERMIVLEGCTDFRTALTVAEEDYSASICFFCCPKTADDPLCPLPAESWADRDRSDWRDP